MNTGIGWETIGTQEDKATLITRLDNTSTELQGQKGNTRNNTTKQEYTGKTKLELRQGKYKTTKTQEYNSKVQPYSKTKDSVQENIQHRSRTVTGSSRERHLGGR